MMSAVVLFAGALTVDWLLGEPPPRFHPVVWIGRVTRHAEGALFAGGPRRQLISGLVVALGIPAAFAASVACLMAAVQRWPVVQLLVGVWLLKSTFALRALGRAAAVVERALRRGDLDAGRAALRSLCSREAARLAAPAVVAATIESVAENASDSFVAPLFYFVLFGIPGAVAYRAVNTLDAMIGYRGRYEHFGKASARLDDLLNLIPSRLTAAALLVAGALSGRPVGRAVGTMRRDRAKTESPNAGWPMAAMAGLLGVQLAKEGNYCLGDPHDSLGVAKIRDAWRLVRGAGLIVAAIAWLFLTVNGGHGA